MPTGLDDIGDKGIVNFKTKRYVLFPYSFDKLYHPMSLDVFIIDPFGPDCFLFSRKKAN